MWRENKKGGGIEKKKIEDTKGVIRNCKSTERQYIIHYEKGKKILENITEKTTDRAIRFPIKTCGELGCSRRVSSSRFTFAPFLLL